MNRPWYELLPWMTAFAVAMAFLESAVVVDLRALCYPEGFAFPLVPMDRRIAITELVREAATMIMLLAPGALVARRALDRFAWFIYCFGVWDIFYYVFLKAVLDWPLSLFEWDILFLVPVPWVGPVLAPCIVSCGMIVFGGLLLEARRKDPEAKVSRAEWILLLASSAVMLFTFMEEPVRHAFGTSGTAMSVSTGGQALWQWFDYTPHLFRWWLFLAGAGMGGAAILHAGRRWRSPRVASQGRAGQ